MATEKNTENTAAVPAQINRSLKTGGLGRTSEYKIWGLMISRCHRESDSSYHNYGARGITVCDRWRESFLNFYDDMGPRPSKKHSIDRKDNSLGYCKENCRWADRVQQQRNTRKSRFLTHDGQTMTIAEWTETLGLPQQLIGTRLQKGWSVERALSTPVLKTWKRHFSKPSVINNGEGTEDKPSIPSPPEATLF